MAETSMQVAVEGAKAQPNYDTAGEVYKCVWECCHYSI